MPRLGTRKLHHVLCDELDALGVGRDKLFRILRANHLLVKPVRCYRKTTDSRHWLRRHKDLVGGLKITRPEQVWVSDITYVGSGGHHNYLALVTDAYSKRIMGYDLSGSLDASGACRALRMALRGRQYGNQTLIHHSDRGVQYCCADYQKLLRRSGVKVSMTECYDPYANAIAERVNGILKQEFGLEDYRCPLKGLQGVVDWAVEMYNSRRPHLSCDMLTPEQMHRQRALPRATYKTKLPAGACASG